jgi:8-oxo-dGTP pyrophosphatase MutT (NUDIX family)
MELIKELSDKDITSEVVVSSDSYSIRKAARAIVENDDGDIAVLYVEKHNYHKLPGGGLELNENIEEALRREVMEEVGVDISVIDTVGAIIEYRNLFELLQISYCYFTKTIGKAVKPSFTEHEINEGFMLKWVTIEEAINILEQDIPDNYVGKFIQNRDLAFLKYAAKLIGERLT